MTRKTIDLHNFKYNLSPGRPKSRDSVKMRAYWNKMEKVVNKAIENFL